MTGSREEYRFWKIGSWKPGRAVPRAGAGDQPGPLAYSNDGKMLAIASSLSSVQLIDAPTGRALATLEAPDQKRLAWLCFTPDSRELIAATESQIIQIWNLPLIRRELAALKLDWEAPQHPENVSSKKVAPLKLALETRSSATSRSSDLTRHILSSPRDAQAIHNRGHAYAEERKFPEALADFDHAIELEPTKPEYHRCRARFLRTQDRLEEAAQGFTHFLELMPRVAQGYFERAAVYFQLKDHEKAVVDFEHALSVDPRDKPSARMLGFLLVTGPEKLRDAAKALKLVEGIASAEPANHFMQTTVGIAQYRLGEFPKAAETLGKAIELIGESEAALDAFCLAMTYQQLAQPDRAQEYMKRALTWKEKQSRFSPEQIDTVARLQAEAEAVLGQKPAQ